MIRTAFPRLAEIRSIQTGGGDPEGSVGSQMIYPINDSRADGSTTPLSRPATAGGAIWTRLLPQPA